jgi:transposase
MAGSTPLEQWRQAGRWPECLDQIWKKLEQRHGRSGASCGKQTTVIGYQESEQLDAEPAKYFVVVTRREKRACKFCEEGGVKAAPLPARIIEKSLVSDRIVIGTVVEKYCDHLPLYRQSVILEREAGIEISRATLDGWVMRVGELLIPMTAVMRNELVGGSYIQADETPVSVQMHDGRGKNLQAYLWQYSRPGGGVVFDFRLGRGREGPRKFLGNFEGLLQTDGYAAYEQVGGPKMVHAACWAHYPDSNVIQSKLRKPFIHLFSEPIAKKPLHIMSKLLEEGHQLRRRLPLPSPSWCESGPLPECVKNLALHPQVRSDVAAGCADGCVAKVVADYRDIDACLQKGDCAAMAQHVWRHVARSLRRLRCQTNVFLQKVSHAVSGQRSSAVASEENVVPSIDTE